MREVFGQLVDEQTRCAHWSGPTDVIAIRFPCCDRYYACFDCHASLETHEPLRWGADQTDEKAVLCGVCGGEMTVNAYLTSGFTCPTCNAAFNPGCVSHHDLYFTLDPA